MKDFKQPCHLIGFNLFNYMGIWWEKLSEYWYIQLLKRNCNASHQSCCLVGSIDASKAGFN